MTSGIGYQGGRYVLRQFDADDSSRCYGFWQDYYDCYGTGSAVMGMELTCSECGPSKAVQSGSRQLHGMSASYEGGISSSRSLVDAEIESGTDKTGMGQATEGGTSSPNRETGIQRRGVKEDCVEIGIH